MLLVHIFMSHLKNVRRDTAEEKEFDIVIQMTLEHVLGQRFKEKKMDEKSNF